jgi:hypothetical protein
MFRSKSLAFEDRDIKQEMTVVGVLHHSAPSKEI